MLLRHGPLVLLAFLLNSCSPKDRWYSIPEQYQPAPGTDTGTDDEYIDMSNGNADSYIVKDFWPKTEVGGWRWTFAEPTLKFPVEPREPLHFRMDFSIASQTFQRTGPVHVSVFIDGQLLGSIACPKPDRYQFDQPVPVAWIHAGQPTIVAAKANKLWATSDGRQLGFIIRSAGFLH